MKKKKETKNNTQLPEIAICDIVNVINVFGQLYQGLYVVSEIDRNVITLIKQV